MASAIAAIGRPVAGSNSSDGAALRLFARRCAIAAIDERQRCAIAAVDDWRTGAIGQ
jgi:hypothetical protein